LKSIICIFSKTPGVSKVKTRLAKSIGHESAQEFFKKSVDLTLSEVKNLSHDYVVAVAEDTTEAHEYWREHNIINQVSGSLGHKLDGVYKEYKDKYHSVFFIGADSPHLNFSDLSLKINEFNESSFDYLLGEAQDGGYYIFGGKKELDLNDWLQVPYSASNTSEEFKKVLGHSIMSLPIDFDVDDIEDLKTLKKLDSSRLSASQKSFIAWLNDKF
jgi:glycosyltransferase A (GT-A) superfamily protein (DUF2064 family)